MATSSITKRFVIQDEKTSLALTNALKFSKKILELIECLGSKNISKVLDIFRYGNSNEKCKRK